LHKAARCGHTEVALLLISNGADVNSLDHDGLTPLDLANMPTRFHNSAMISLLKSEQHRIKVFALIHNYIQYAPISNY